MPLLRAAAVPAAVAVFAACYRERSDASVRDTTRQAALRAPMTTTSPVSLRLELDVPARVASEDSVPLTLRARNTGSRPLELYLRGRVIAFDLVVADQSGAVVWQRLQDQAIPAIVQVKVLGAGDALEFRHTWDLRTNRGRPVPPGRYTVVGLLLRDEVEPFRTPPAQLEVVAP
jgi:hypothetical protein